MNRYTCPACLAGLHPGANISLTYDLLSRKLTTTPTRKLMA